MNQTSSICISAVGDIALNGGYHQLASKGDARALAGAIAPLLAHSDIVVGNLEGPLTTRPAVQPPWCFTLHGHPNYASVLRDAGLSALSLANNHMMDYGWEGLEETRAHLNAAGIRPFGAGKNLKEAREPIQIVVHGVRVAFLAYCNVSVLAPIYADIDRPGIAPARPSYIFEDIAAARPKNDIVIVCMHWGQEHVHYPTPKYRQLARQIIRAGANLIIGHHPHVLQGVEKIGNAAIAYSLGNFTFSNEHWRGINRKGEVFEMPYRLSEHARRAAVWRVLMNRSGFVVEEKLIPTFIGQNLLPALELRPERYEDMNAYGRQLSRRGYAAFWTFQMLRSRMHALVEQQCDERNHILRRLLRLRPRHLRDLRRLFMREWEQLRGME